MILSGMLYDRTLADIIAADEIRQSQIDYSDDAQIATLRRGTINGSDFNRIKDAQKKLKALLNQYGYWNNTLNQLENATSAQKIFEQSEFDSIVENDFILKDSFFNYETTPTDVQPIFFYEEINKLEKILVDIDNMIDNMIDNIKECGTVECSQS